MQQSATITALTVLGDAILTIDHSARICSMNRPAEALTGWSQEEASGRPLDEICRFMDPVTHEPVENPAREALRTVGRDPVPQPFLMTNRLGHEHLVVTSLAVTCENNNGGEVTGAVLIVRPAARASLQEGPTESQLRSILESATDYAILTLDMSGRITTWNSGAAHLLGYSDSEVIGRDGAILFTPEDRERNQPELEQRVAMEAGRARDERWHLRKDGTRFWASGLMMLLRNEVGEIFGFLKILRDLTEQKRAQDSWLASDQLARRRLAEIQAIYHDAPVGLCFMDRELRFIKINERLAAVNARPVSDHIGRTLREVMPGFANQLELLLRSVIETGKPLQDIEFRGRTSAEPEVERIWLLNCQAVRDGDGAVLGLTAVVHDITERTQSQERLRDQLEVNQALTERYRTLTELIPQLIWTGLPDGEIDYCNDRWLRYTGLSEEHVCSGGWVQPLHPDDRESTLAAWSRAVAEGGEYYVEQRLRRADGAYRWFLTRAVPLRGREGAIVKWFGTCTDIEDRKRVEQELARHREHLEELVVERTEALRESLEQLRRSERLASIGTLAAGVAHEINNPLNSILLTAQYALQADDTDEVSNSLKTIMQESKRGGRIVRGILKFAKEEKTPKVPSHVNDAVRHAVDIARTYIAAGDMKLDLQLAENLPLVAMNATEFHQVIVNLLQNAAQAATVPVHVVISTAEMMGGVQLIVSDDGPGIPPEHLPQIFDPFFSTRQAHGGTGLGLSICHGIVTDHGGRIEVRSRPGSGSTFTITLPRASTAAGERAGGPTHPDPV